MGEKSRDNFAPAQKISAERFEKIFSERKECKDCTNWKWNGKTTYQGMPYGKCEKYGSYKTDRKIACEESFEGK